MSVSLACSQYEVEPEYRDYWPEYVGDRDDDGGDQRTGAEFHDNELLEQLCRLIEEAPDTQDELIPGVRMLPRLALVASTPTATLTPDDVMLRLATMAEQVLGDLNAGLREDESPETELAIARVTRIADRLKAWLGRSRPPKRARSEAQLTLL